MCGVRHESGPNGALIEPHSLERIDLLIGLTIAAVTLGCQLAGGLRALWALVGLVISTLFAIGVQVDVGTFISNTTAMAGPTARGMAILETTLSSYVIYALAFRWVLRPAISYLQQHRAIKVFDKRLGLVFGPLIGTLICSIAVAIAVRFPIGVDVRSEIETSRLGSSLVTLAYTLQPALRGFTPSSDAQPLFKTDVVTRSRPSNLDVPADLSVMLDPKAEATLLGLINHARLTEGLPALTLDARAADVARRHSAEMFRLRYFGHVSPRSGSAVDRLRADGIRLARSAEALALAPLSLAAHLGLMHNAVDRANLLDPTFARVGIGVVAAEPYGLMVTEVFLQGP